MDKQMCSRILQMILSLCSWVPQSTSWIVNLRHGCFIPASSYKKRKEKSPFAKWQTAWLATTKALKGGMNGVLSLERLAEMRPFSFYLPRGDWSRTGFALAVYSKWAVENRGHLFVGFVNCVFSPDWGFCGCSPSSKISTKQSPFPSTSVILTLTCNTHPFDLIFFLFPLCVLYVNLLIWTPWSILMKNTDATLRPGFFFK